MQWLVSIKSGTKTDIWWTLVFWNSCECYFDMYHVNSVADHVHPLMATVCPNSSGLFRLDNAPYYTTKIVQEKFEKHDKEIKGLTWPPNSPDLIEHLWDVLDRPMSNPWRPKKHNLIWYFTCALWSTPYSYMNVLTLVQFWYHTAHRPQPQETNRPCKHWNHSEFAEFTSSSAMLVDYSPHEGLRSAHMQCSHRTTETHLLNKCVFFKKSWSRCFVAKH